MKDAKKDAQKSETAHKRRTARDVGSSLVEYALLVALIAVVCIGAITFFGAGGQNSLTNSTNSIVGAN